MDMKAFDAAASAANEVDIAGAPLPVATPAARGAPGEPQGPPENAAPRPWLRPAVLDRVEQIAILALWVWLVQRVVSFYLRDSDVSHLLPLISETSVMVFTVIRRPTQAITLDPGDWLLAITATAAPMLLQPGFDSIPSARVAAVVLLLVGNLGQAMAKLSLRRSFGIAPANRGVKVDGAYRFVRHPMYAGYLLVHIGNLLLFPSWTNALIYAVGWAAQIKRLLAEEALLAQDPAYRDYMARVRWHLVPGIF